MHRDEIRTFRGNIETHLLRIFSFSRPRARGLPPTVVQPQFPDQEPRVALPQNFVAPTRCQSTRERAIRIIVRAFSRMMIPSLLLGALLVYVVADVVPIAWIEAFMSYWPLIALGLTACLAFLAIRKAMVERDQS